MRISCAVSSLATHNACVVNKTTDYCFPAERHNKCVGKYVLLDNVGEQRHMQCYMACPSICSVLFIGKHHFGECPPCSETCGEKGYADGSQRADIRLTKILNSHTHAAQRTSPSWINTKSRRWWNGNCCVLLMGISLDLNPLTIEQFYLRWLQPSLDNITFNDIAKPEK